MEIKDKKGSKNLMANHLLRFPKTVQKNQAQIDYAFPDERIVALFQVEFSPWFADIANFLAEGIIPYALTS